VVVTYQDETDCVVDLLGYFLGGDEIVLLAICMEENKGINGRVQDESHALSSPNHKENTRTRPTSDPTGPILVLILKRPILILSTRMGPTGVGRTQDYMDVGQEGKERGSSTAGFFGPGSRQALLWSDLSFICWLLFHVRERNLHGEVCQR